MVKANGLCSSIGSRTILVDCFTIMACIESKIKFLFVSILHQTNTFKSCNPKWFLLVSIPVLHFCINFWYNTTNKIGASTGSSLSLHWRR